MIKVIVETEDEKIIIERASYDYTWCNVLEVFMAALKAMGFQFAVGKVLDVIDEVEE